jgi:hypothetical protein
MPKALGAGSTRTLQPDLGVVPKPVRGFARHDSPEWLALIEGASTTQDAASAPQEPPGALKDAHDALRAALGEEATYPHARRIVRALNNHLRELDREAEGW